ncbi:glycoside hydrolase family 18 protein [Hysterangium stoloniferum]|nr:glycoside hydrolase family 18 protein [Hysterangium stoloniferum]
MYLFCFLICIPAIFAVPTKTKSATPSPTILGPQPPHFVAYTDESEFGIPKASDLKGFNTLNLAFLLTSGPADQAQAWTQLSDSQRANLKADYKSNNITLMVSAFGSTESPTTDGKDPTLLAESMASWVRQWDMDGIDVDYEDFEAVGNGQAVSWLETFTTVLRDKLPAGEFVITHAPVAPWFGKGQLYARLNTTVGKDIDWYNVQFYSQGTAYTTCDTLVSKSGDPFPGTSILEIVASGVPQYKVVMGKPGTAANAGAPDFETPPNPHINGFVETKTLATCMARAKQHGWNGGVMVWEYPDGNSTWIQAVRKFAWPFHSKN